MSATGRSKTPAASARACWRACSALTSQADFLVFPAVDGAPAGAPALLPETYAQFASTLFANVTGQPALYLPPAPGAGHSGFQVAGPRLSDARLLSLGEYLLNLRAGRPLAMDFEAVIGLEIHVELNCTTKMFCDCPNRYGDEPNINTCPICLWFPGAMPRFSQQALEKASLLCLGLGAELQPRSAFDQKVYYYPDLPKGFQLSQAHLPLSRGGGIDITDESGKPKRARLHHIHMEEDVAKLVHEMEGRLPISLVDFNRAGTPLVEIVTEPDFRSPYEAMEFLKALRTQVRYAGCSECSMENGTMRVDANISIRPRGTTQMNTKVEVKNMNSVRHVGDAIAYEISRQTAAVQAGETVILHTRLWDPDKKVTLPMRAKFEGPCVPDPSVPVIELTPEWIEKMRSRLPEMPAARAERFVKQHGLTAEEARFLSSDLEVAGYFEALIGRGHRAAHGHALAHHATDPGRQRAAAGTRQFAGDPGPLCRAAQDALARTRSTPTRRARCWCICSTVTRRTGGDRQRPRIPAGLRYRRPRCADRQGSGRATGGCGRCPEGAG